MTETAADAPATTRPLDDATIEALARTPRLLVACDYDGTLSPIVENPADAVPIRESVVALQQLCETPDTSVAVVSGRALSDLAQRVDLPPRVHLVGSHGSEFEPGFATTITEKQKARLREIDEAISELVESTPGASIERKPSSVAYHYRNAEEQAGLAAAKALGEKFEKTAGVFVKRGKMVLELTVIKADKGTALDTIRRTAHAYAVLFVGDDVTDEDGFRTLRGPDFGVKVGGGETAASFRVDGPREVAQLLAKLSELRDRWFGGQAFAPIEHHAMLSDQRIIALETPDARINWMCAPRVDSPALFAELLGGPAAGYFSIEPVGEFGVSEQAYTDSSMSLRTTLGGVTVTDFLDMSDERGSRRAGRSDLVRIVDGAGEVKIEFAPRLDFGRQPTKLVLHGSAVEVAGAPEPIILHAPGVEWDLRTEGPHQTAVAIADPSLGAIHLTLRIGTSSLREPLLPATERLARTDTTWRSWAERLELPELARDQVLRSALLLKSLVYGPTGAIAAAGTTSLPETLGGIRNWDYRFCWPRDAAIAALALTRLGSISEAMHFIEWLGIAFEHAVSLDRLSPIYTVTGDELSTEGEIGELSGYAGSRPVRVGNAASRQVQLDVFGPILDLFCALAELDAPLTPQHWRIIDAIVDAVRSGWHEPDHGIWEIRDEPRHHVHSRVMCWLTVDRAIRAAEVTKSKVKPEWIALRDEIAADIEHHAWSESLGSFANAYGHDVLDAATLWVGLSGMLTPDDPRVKKTVDAIEAELREGPVVYRYKYDDGLPGIEGGFHLCTCWLVLSKLAIGNQDTARALFDEYLTLGGPTGVYPEQYDPNTGVSLGNTPQAYSHAGLIECAVALSAR